MSAEIEIERDVRSNVLAVGYKSGDGTIVVTHVLTARLPPMTKQKLAELSLKLDHFFKTTTPDPSP